MLLPTSCSIPALPLRVLKTTIVHSQIKTQHPTELKQNENEKSHPHLALIHSHQLVWPNTRRKKDSPQAEASRFTHHLVSQTVWGATPLNRPKRYFDTRHWPKIWEPPKVRLGSIVLPRHCGSSHCPHDDFPWSGNTPAFNQRSKRAGLMASRRGSGE